MNSWPLLMERITLLKSSANGEKHWIQRRLSRPCSPGSSYLKPSSNLHGIICRTLFFFMLAGRFPVLMFSFIMRMFVSFWVEKLHTAGKQVVESTINTAYNQNQRVSSKDCDSTGQDECSTAWSAAMWKFCSLKIHLCFCKIQ